MNHPMAVGAQQRHFLDARLSFGRQRGEGHRMVAFDLALAQFPVDSGEVKRAHGAAKPSFP